MTLILNDALNLSYWLTKTTMFGLFKGSRWLMSSTPAKETKLDPIESKPSGAIESRLSTLFSKLPEEDRIYSLSVAIADHNNSLFKDFDLNQEGECVGIEFLDSKTRYSLGSIQFKLNFENNFTIEQLRRELPAKLEPNLAVCDWYITKLEYNEQGGMSFGKIRIANSDSLSSYFNSSFVLSDGKIRIHVDF